LILKRSIPAPIDVRILREVVEGFRRAVETRRDVMPSIVLRQSIDAAGAALQGSRPRLRRCEL
jgi:hypothetical protein